MPYQLYSLLEAVFVSILSNIFNKVEGQFVIDVKNKIILIKVFTINLDIPVILNLNQMSDLENMSFISIFILKLFIFKSNMKVGQFSMFPYWPSLVLVFTHSLNSKYMNIFMKTF